MSHCGHDHGSSSDTRRLLLALGVIVVFLIVEIIGGLLSQSLALIADAAHMATDALALSLAASAQWVASRPAGPNLHFGYQRAKVLAAFVNGIALLIVLLWIVYEAISRLFNPVEVEWRTMLVVAVLGLVANGVAFAVLHQGQVSHNINVRGAMLHVASDFLGSVVAVIGGITIALSGSSRIDPILSVIVAALIANAAIRLLRETGHVLLEGAPANICAGEIEQDLHSWLPAVRDIHNVQIWQITPESPQITLHARLFEGENPEATLTNLKERLKNKFGISQSTIQIEFSADCPDCVGEAVVRRAAVQLGDDVGHPRQVRQEDDTPTKQGIDKATSDPGHGSLPGGVVTARPQKA
ncbi:MAG: cation diffusion facilitator family transporter [Pseudomonadota bacterium]